MARSLPELSDDDLRDLLRAVSDHVDHSYNAVMAEIDRRAARRQANAQMLISVVSIAIAIAVVALVVSALR